MHHAKFGDSDGVLHVHCAAGSCTSVCMTLQRFLGAWVADENDDESMDGPHVGISFVNSRNAPAIADAATYRRRNRDQ